MTIDKAIELNREASKSLRAHGFPDNAAAVDLGIEAMKRLEHLRKDFPSLRYELLPEETKEDAVDAGKG